MEEKSNWSVTMIIVLFMLAAEAVLLT